MEEQATTLNTANGQIVYRFHARDLHLVMGPAAPGKPVRFHGRIDGQPPGAAHGADVDDQGNGTVADQRLHQLIRQPGPIADRTFEITFLDPGSRPIRSPSARSRTHGELGDRRPRRAMTTSGRPRLEP
jgi:hypothetical protein